MVHKNSLVSILIPTYNRAKMVGKSIESALSQTITDIEIIVCDNCSTDNTVKVVHSYTKKDSRLRLVVNETNIGPTRNWRRCVENARGKYAKLLFSDDWIDSEYIEKTLPILEKNKDIGFIFTKTSVHDLLKNINCHNSYKIGPTGVYPLSFYINYYLLGKGPVMPVSPSCALFRTDDLRNQLVVEIPNNLGLDLSRNGAGPDLLMFLNMAFRYDKFGFIDETLSHFGLHSGCFTIQEDLWEYYQLAICDFVKKYHLPSQKKKRFYSKLAWNLYKRGKFADFEKFVSKKLTIRDIDINLLMCGTFKTIKGVIKSFKIKKIDANL